MIRGLRQQALTDALAKRLQGMAIFPRARDGLVDQVVERASLLRSFPRYHHQPASALAFQPFPSNEVLIGLADRVVVNLQSSREFADAGHELSVQIGRAHV